MLYLKVSTACTVKLGPFYSATDGSALTGLTINQASVRLSKNGGNIAQKSDSTACTHDELGVYDCPLNTTDTNTLGRLQVYVSASGGFVVPHDFIVVTANVYDTLCSTDSFDVNLNASQTGVTIENVTNVLTKTGFSLAADQSSVRIGEVDQVNDKTGYALSAAGIDAIWDEAITGHTTASTMGLTVWNILRLLKNKRSIVSTTETLFADNGTDALFQWTLDSATPPITSKTPV